MKTYILLYAHFKKRFNPIPPGHAVHLEFVSLAKTPHFYTFATQIALRWMSKFRARPHWGKQWSFVPNIHTYLQQVRLLYNLSDRVNSVEYRVTSNFRGRLITEMAHCSHLRIGKWDTCFNIHVCLYTDNVAQIY